MPDPVIALWIAAKAAFQRENTCSDRTEKARHFNNGMGHWIAIPHTVPTSEAGAAKLVEYALQEIEEAHWMACHPEAVPALRRMTSLLAAGLRATDLPELRALLGRVSAAAEASGADDIKAAAASLAAYALRPRLAATMPPATPPRRLRQLKDRKGRLHASRLSAPEPWGEGVNPVQGSH